MSKKSLVGAAFVVVVLAAVLMTSHGTVLSVDGPSGPGRYQAAVVGSRNRLFTASLLLDTGSGKSWGTPNVDSGPQGWAEVEEGEGVPAPGAAQFGRFQVATEYCGDKLGQERLGAVRVDTLTGKLWHLQSGTRPWRWMLLRDPDTGPAGAK